MSHRASYFLPLALMVVSAYAVQTARAGDKVQVHGSVQADIFVPDDL